MGPLAMLILIVAALSLFTATMIRRLDVMRAAQPDRRTDHPGRRLRSLLAIGFGQRKLLYEKGPGWMHAAIFAGFLKILPVFLMVLPGVIGYVLFQEKIGDDNDATLMVMMKELLPVGIRGLMAAGLLAASIEHEVSGPYHRDLKDALLDEIRAVFNADIVGMASPLVLMTQNSPALAACLRALPLD